MSGEILALLTAPLWLGLLFLNANNCRNTVRLYGRKTLPAAAAHGRTIRESGQRSYVALALLGLLLVLGLASKYSGGGIPGPILLVMGAVYLDNLWRRVSPPAVVVLTTSTESGVRLVSSIRRRLMREYLGGLSVAFLLRPSLDEDLTFHYAYGLGPYNLRQVGSHEGHWPSAVRRVLGHVPCVVLDLRHGTAPVDEELRLVVEQNVVAKTFVLSRPAAGSADLPASRVLRSVDELVEAVVGHLRRRQAARDGG